MTSTIFQTVAQFLPTIGWGTIIAFVAWAWKKSIVLGIDLSKTQERSQKAADQINTMATNCFPTMQNALKTLNEKTDVGNIHLSEIATNLAVLGGIIKDRGRV